MKINTADLDKYEYYVGADEVGYGCLAGSVVICAVRADKQWHLDGLKDSKKLSKSKREMMRGLLNKEYEKGNIDFEIAERTSFAIDNIGIANALEETYTEAVCKVLERANIFPGSLVIIDGSVQRGSINQFSNSTIRTMVKADNSISTVMAASILAKTYRDEKMRELHNLYPVYDWQNNVGYGTAKHLSGLKEFGLCPLHRKSYEPIKSMVK